MAKSYKIEASDPDKLTIVWASSMNKEDEYYTFNFWELYPTQLEQIESNIRELIEAGVLKYVLISNIVQPDKGGRPHADNWYISETKPKKLPKGYKHVFEKFPWEKDSNFYTKPLLVFNGSPKGYIDEYLRLWLAEDLRHPSTNLLSCNRQIGITAGAILDIIEEHSHKHLLVGTWNLPNSQDHEELDLMATLLFLERKGVLKLEGYISKKTETDYVEAKSLFLRISLTDRFFHVFSKEGRSRYALFDFDLLCALEESQKVITCELPYRLTCEGKEYKLNRGCVPFVLMNRAMADKFLASVPIEAIGKELAKKEKEVLKAIENFRSALRERFKFPEEETFFEVKDGMVRFKATIFQKKKQSVRI